VREWIYVLDHCIALTKILFYGRTGEIYNISSGNEISDFDVAKKILGLVGKPDSAIERQMTVLFQPKDVFLTATN